MKKAFLCVTFVILLLLCGYADSSDITGYRDLTDAKIESFYTGELSLTVGQTDADRYFKLSGIAPEDIELVSSDSTVCTVEPDHVELAAYCYYRVNGIAAGKTEIYATADGGRIVSPRIAVTVTEDKSAVSEAVETAAPETAEPTVTERVQAVEVEQTPPKTDASASETESPSAAAPASADDHTAAYYVLNKNKKKIHLPSCESVGKIAEKNYAETDSYADAIANGFIPCKICNP